VILVAEMMQLMMIFGIIMMMETHASSVMMGLMVLRVVMRKEPQAEITVTVMKNAQV